MDSFVEQKLTEAYDSALQTIKELTDAEEGIEEEPSGDMPKNGDEEQDNKIFLYLGVFAFMALIASALLLYVARTRSTIHKI